MNASSFRVSNTLFITFACGSQLMASNSDPFFSPGPLRSVQLNARFFAGMGEELSEWNALGNRRPRSS